jgi:metal-responsive CopG/Arc/MetJ family transcriptional regulator
MIPRLPLPPPLAPKVQKVAVITPSDLLDRIDDYRRGLPGLPNRSIAIRKLIELGLETVAKGEKKPKGKPKA